MSALPETSQMRSCAHCIHGQWIKLTDAAVCGYPREREPHVVDYTVIRMGLVATRCDAARRCKHFSPKRHSGTEFDYQRDASEAEAAYKAHPSSKNFEDLQAAKAALKRHFPPVSSVL